MQGDELILTGAPVLPWCDNFWHRLSNLVT